MSELIAGGGFEVTEMERGYIAGPRVAAYTYRGVARPAAGHGASGLEVKPAEGR
jgi:hypothetical protein